MNRFYLLIILIVLTTCKCKEIVHKVVGINLEPKSAGEIIKHTYYTLAYSESDEQAYWVFYQLTPEFINGTQSRTDDFRTDPLVSTGSASLADYSGSGYDRGHLCPAADMKLNLISMSESFYLSNMSPQTPGFNRGVWRKLENQVREWANEFDGLYIATGGILEDTLEHIGLNQVSVPRYFYKAIFSKKNGMIAFILPNEGTSAPLAQFAVSVDSVESITRIDFFSGLEDNNENQLESKIRISEWDF